MERRRKGSLPKKLRDIVEKVNQAVRSAIMDHKRAGNPIAVWQNGKSVIIAPSQIPDFD